jgi:hypothetical protein
MLAPMIDRASGRRIALSVTGAIALVGCGSRGASRPPPADPPTADAGTADAARALAAAATDERPRPGHARLTITGALTATVDADGVSCNDGWFWTSTQELGLTRARPRWQMTVYQEAPGAPWQAGLTVGEPSATPVTFTWTGAAAAPALTLRPTGAALDLTLRRPDDSDVRVTGELTCATFPTAPVPPAVMALLADVAAAPVRPFATFDFGRAHDPAAASAIVRADADVAAMLGRLRRELPTGWLAFLGTDRFLGDASPPPDSVELVVARGVAPFDTLRIARTDATNYDMQTEALIHALTAWDQAWGIDIEHATTDTIELSLRRMPPDLDAFAREVYALCPDVVDQGTGTVAALAAEIGARGRVYLWWD